MSSGGTLAPRFFAAADTLAPSRAFAPLIKKRSTPRAVFTSIVELKKKWTAGTKLIAKQTRIARAAASSTLWAPIAAAPPRRSKTGTAKKKAARTARLESKTTSASPPEREPMMMRALSSTDIAPAVK